MVRYLQEFRDGAAARTLAAQIRSLASRPVNLMEVCGTHTVAIFRHGIRQLLPAAVNMLSGPGCPVCVTPNAEIDKAIALAGQAGVTLATFGDMMKVPGELSEPPAGQGGRQQRAGGLLGPRRPAHRLRQSAAASGVLRCGV